MTIRTTVTDSSINQGTLVPWYYVVAVQLKKSHMSVIDFYIMSVTAASLPPYPNTVFNSMVCKQARKFEKRSSTGIGGDLTQSRLAAFLVWYADVIKQEYNNTWSKEFKYSSLKGYTV